jgi:2-epi-5-epi-valiolone synthase
MLRIDTTTPSRLVFNMTSSIEKDINFRWGNISEIILNEYSQKNILAFIDINVYEASDVWSKLEEKHPNFTLIPTNLTESSKQVKSLLSCLERIENVGLSRRGDILLAIGGGVLLDLISLAANLYRRGVSVIKVPTTLLGFVDASVGIKTGVNYLGQRNRLGSYYLDYNVIYDCSLLTTINVDLVREGLGEIYKIAIIKSKELFELLERHSEEITSPKFYQTEAGNRIISLSIQLMLEELHDNPTETNLKRCVDFGHSFSPLVEMKSLTSDDVPEIPHGIAVGADCVITSIIAYNRGILDKKSLNRIIKIAQTINFLPDHPLYKRNDIMWSSLVDMTTHRAGNQNLPIPTEIGKFTFLQDITYDEMSRATKKFVSLSES